MIRKLLIANRGEIAVRIARTCREMGIEVVAVHSSADRDSEVVRLADIAVNIGPPAPRRSYLNIPNIVEAALQTGADAIHPGYGFLSEDPDFAEICESAGLTFIGPPPSVMQDMGNKATARGLMQQAGLPMLPGVVEPVRSVGDGQEIAAHIGYPVIIKAAAGGGGRGMSVVHSAADFSEAFVSTREVARAIFNDPAVYVERYLAGARHVEVQVLCDQYGNGVFLGERDCSLQRRHQKLLEEAPAAHMTVAQREHLGALAVRGALSVGYTGAGTMEFLVDGSGEPYFMEMNARIQVEHPVTEMLTGIDLIREQILIAEGLPLAFGATGCPLQRSRHRMPDQRGGPSAGVRTDSRSARRLQSAGRAMDAAGHRVPGGRSGKSALRLTAGQTHRVGADPGSGTLQDGPGTGRIGGRRPRPVHDGDPAPGIAAASRHSRRPA